MDPRPHSGRPTEPWENNFLLSVWNSVTFLSLLAGVKWLCGVLGAAAYATMTGNVQLAGVFALSAIGAAMFARVGGNAFDVPVKQRMDAFRLPNLWLAFGLLGAAAWVVRAVLIGKGVVPTGEIPPTVIDWLFAPSMLGWLQNIGA